MSVKISHMKKKYFDIETQGIFSSMMTKGIEIPKCKALQYLGSIIQKMVKAKKMITI